MNNLTRYAIDRDLDALAGKARSYRQFEISDALREILNRLRKLNAIEDEIRQAELHALVRERDSSEG